MPDLLSLCIQKFTDARFSIADAIETLYEVNKTEAWKESFSSFSDFCESGLKISRATGSQYLTVYEHYAIGAGLTVKQLREADIAKLYEARKLGGSPTDQYAKAMTLTRAELKDESQEEKFGKDHQHNFGAERFAKCEDCGRWVKI